ncbi:MAG: hypothetical protein AB7J40_01630 [Candidatus Altimarinota bacterium]
MFGLRGKLGEVPPRTFLNFSSGREEDGRVYCPETAKMMIAFKGFFLRLAIDGGSSAFDDV